jgi:L-threonylcarbamoyladenylate synthase
LIGRSLRIAADIIAEGGVIAYPAEACFGLGCDPNNNAALARVRLLKSRSLDQGFILVSDSLERLLGYIDWPSLKPDQRELVMASWPGPVSWLIPAGGQAGSELTGCHDTLAVRVSAFKPLRDLCAATKTALVSTSANLHGKPPLKTAADVAGEFGEQIDYIIDAPIQGLDKPSQIIDIRTRTTIR